jgi:hypothetical protein
MRIAYVALVLSCMLGLAPQSGAQEAHGSAKGRSGSRGAKGVHTSSSGNAEDTDDDDSTIDGSKIFTGDTDVVPVGQWSTSFNYLTSNAKRGFDEKGAQVPLGLSRKAEQYLGSLTTGLVENLDLTLVGGFTRQADALGAFGGTNFPLGVGGSGPSVASLTAHWHCWEDAGGRSLSISGGPVLQEQLRNETTVYRPGPSFLSWQQSAVFRQDFKPFSANLEVYYAFPIQSSSSSFQQFGANLALGWQANSWLLPVVELNYGNLLPLDGPPSESLGITLGVVLKPTDQINLVLGVQKTILGRNIESFTTYAVGTTVQF